MKFQDYELKGSYFTAGINLPMYIGIKKGNRFIVSEHPTGELLKGKTYPMKIAGVQAVHGESMFFTSPVKGASGLTSSAFFPLTEDAISSITKDIVHGEGSQYYVKPEEGLIKKFTVGAKHLLIFVAIIFIVITYIKAHGNK